MLRELKMKSCKHISSSNPPASFPIFETRDIDIAMTMRWETTVQHAMQQILLLFKPNNLNFKNL